MKEKFHLESLNNYNYYTINRLGGEKYGEKNIMQLEQILDSRHFKPRLKNGVLFFLNDLFQKPEIIGKKELRHIFYEDNLDYIRAVFGTENNRTGVHFFISTFYVQKKMRQAKLKMTLTKYLESCAEKNIKPHYSSNDELVLLTDKTDTSELEALCRKNGEVSRIITISAEEVFPDTSIKKIVNIK